MAKHNGMRPQDIVVLLKKITSEGKDMLNKDLAVSLGISASEISEALERCRIASLVDISKKRVQVLALKDFLVYGLGYVFPAQPGAVVRGVPTAVSASPIKDKINGGSEVFVWPYKKGSVRGQSIEPLYSSVPEAVGKDDELYKLLVIIDTLRMGRVREKEVAIAELEKFLNAYGEK